MSVNLDRACPVPNVNNVVLTAEILGRIDLKTLACLVPIVPVRYPDGNPVVIQGKVKVPYFGMPNVLISARSKDASRGIRTGGVMANMVSIDLQCMEKNVNFKVSSKNLQVTGATSSEMGTYAFRVLVEHIKMFRDNLEHLRSLSEDVRNRTLQTILGWDPQKIRFPLAMPEIQNESAPGGPSIPNIDTRLAIFICSYAHECANQIKFAEKINELLSCSGICTADLGLGQVSVINTVCNYNYQLGELPIGDLAAYLLQLGYMVEYHNWKAAAYFKVCIQVENLAPAKNGQIKGHKFRIGKEGAVTQTSPTPADQAYAACQRVYADVVRCLKMV